MPWWGQLAATGEGLVALTDTPDDIAFRINTDRKGGQTVHPYWQASLGNFRYKRRMTYQFFDKADVVKLAKTYRRHAEKRGTAVTLKEKAAARPNVDILRGGLILDLFMMNDCSMYPEWNRKTSYMTADEGLRRYQGLMKAADVRKGVAHIDGWCRSGYDFYHPDVLPPDEKIGGWDGLRRMADGIQAMGHGFELHDQYSDIYAHTEAFKTDCTVLDLSGVHPENKEWLGGRQRWLCPKKTMFFTERNFSEIREKIKPSSVYIDCITSGQLRECYDQNHLCSRTDAREAWSEIFKMCQNRGWMTGSEGLSDWAIPYIDHGSTPVAHKPFDLKDTLEIPFGTPIPLYNLVWHDCVVNTGGGKGDGALWTMLWAGTPQISSSGCIHGLDCEESSPGEKDAAFVRSLKPMLELSEKAGFEEMTGLKLHDANGRVQTTTFGDGTEVTVDFDRKTCSFNGRQVDFSETT